MKEIRSTANQKIKDLMRLQNKKGRDASGRFLIEGEHLVQEAMKSGWLEEVYIQEGSRFDWLDTEPVICSQAVMNKLSQQNSEAKIIASAAIPKLDMQLDASKPIVLLDRVQDPGNVGTLFRLAAAFGFAGLILSKGCADPFGFKTIQASQGAVFQIPFIYADLSEFMDQNPQFHYYAAALHRDSRKLLDLTFAPGTALMLGNEGQGLKEELIQKAEICFEIEMANFESLNVASAGSICMYSIFIQNQ